MQFVMASSSRLLKIFTVSRPLLVSAETKILVGPSRVTMPAELNKMVQYIILSIHMMFEDNQNHLKRKFLVAKLYYGLTDHKRSTSRLAL